VTIVKFKRLHVEAIVPEYKTKGASGADVFSVEDIDIPAGEARLVPLGFSVSIPPGLEMQIRPRSGLALKHRITVLNTPGTVDNDYRGEVKVILMNLGSDVFRVSKGDRIAQAIIAPTISVTYQEVEDLDETARGAGGFESTGRT
jgi:dUTP pyrophosphatase